MCWYKKPPLTPHDVRLLWHLMVPKAMGGGHLTNFLQYVTQWFGTIKALAFYWIARSYLTGVTAAMLRWHMSNMDVRYTLLYPDLRWAMTQLKRHSKTFDSIRLIPIYDVIIGSENGLAPDEIMIQSSQAYIRFHLPLDKNGRRFAADIFRCIFVIEIFVFWLKFHWRLFLRLQLKINQHWFRLCLISHTRFTDAYLRP